MMGLTLKMRCRHCNSEVSQSETVCPKCGKSPHKSSSEPETPISTAPETPTLDCPSCENGNSGHESIEGQPEHSVSSEVDTGTGCPASKDTGTQAKDTGTQTAASDDGDPPKAPKSKFLCVS